MTNTSYEIACSKGWHDNDELGPDGTPSARQRLAWVALILTEWVEDKDEEDEFILWFINYEGKPVGRISELVDVWVRCADTLGACNEISPDGEREFLKIPVKADRICYALGKAAEATRTGDHALYARILRSVQFIAWSQIVDLNQAPGCPKFADALAAKEAYNRTRSQRHGGKLA